MMESIKDWYKENYPSDELGEEISSKATFEGLIDNLPTTYDYLDVGDSIIRERVFEELARRKEVDYSVVYDRWFYAY